jgi:hypothetical protein
MILKGIRSGSILITISVTGCLGVLFLVLIILRIPRKVSYILLYLSIPWLIYDL